MTSESTFSDHPNNSHQSAGEGAQGQTSAPLSKDRIMTDGARGLLHGTAPSENSLNILMNQGALKQISDHSTSDITVELGGVLLGTVVKGKDQLAIKISAALPVSTVDHGPIHFTFTADTWAQLQKERSSRYPNLDVVGWYHTHPGLGVFFSADDIVVHTAAFVMPWHVALVVDPIRKQGCFFGWRTLADQGSKRELAPLPGFREIVEEESEISTGWNYVEAAVWSRKHSIPTAQASPGQVRAPEGEWLLLPPISPWWGVFLGGLSLLISLLLLLDRLLSTAP